LQNRCFYPGIKNVSSRSLHFEGFTASIKIMHRFLVKFLMIFVALWLPVQGVQAVTMHLHVPSAPNHEVAAPPEHCHHAQHQQTKDQQTKHSQLCDNCANSHLCCSLALLSVAASVSEPIGSQPQIASSPDQFSSTYLEHPQRPPRHSAA
jgi:hypothetical protein